MISSFPPICLEAIFQATSKIQQSMQLPHSHQLSDRKMQLSSQILARKILPYNPTHPYVFGIISSNTYTSTSFKKPLIAWKRYSRCVNQLQSIKSKLMRLLSSLFQCSPNITQLPQERAKSSPLSMKPNPPISFFFLPFFMHPSHNYSSFLKQYRNFGYFPKLVRR